MFLQEKVREINSKFKALETITSIAVWGAGIHTSRLFEKTELLSYPVKCIVDMDGMKQGNRYFGFSIKSPEEAAWDDIGAVVISVPGREKQIRDMLINGFRFKGVVISLYDDKKCIPFYNFYDEQISGVRYMGDYSSWESAEGECNGYDDAAIIDKVISSTKKVLDGDAVWERDSCLFYEQKYVYSICAAILRCAVQNSNKGVRVLDVGGALGSTYLQNRGYLTDVKNLEYVIAEQPEFAEYGHKNMENDVLSFIDSREEYGGRGKFDIVLVSSSLQYIPMYREIISKIVKAKPRYIILDRILVSDRARICKETVPEELYKGSYPVKIFEESEIRDFFGVGYELVEKDVSSVPEEAYFEDGKADSRYYVFRDVDWKP